mgnify:CR=1 FL=1
MREPERIDRILSLIAELWKLAPDMRLGQLLENYVFDRSSSLFRQEDNFTEKRLLEVLKDARQHKSEGSR